MSDHILLTFYVPHFCPSATPPLQGASKTLVGSTGEPTSSGSRLYDPGLKADFPGSLVGKVGSKVGSKIPDTWNRINACSWSFFFTCVLFSIRFTMIYHKSFKSPSVFWKVLVPELLFFGLWPRVTVHSANMLSERSFICKMKRHGDWYSQHGLLENAHHADFWVKSRHTSSTACGLSLKHAIWKYTVPFVMSSCMNI